MLIIVVINIRNNNELNIIIAPSDTTQLPISFRPSEIFDVEIGSTSAAVSLYINPIRKILISGMEINAINVTIPNIPTTFFIVPIHLIYNSTVSEVKPPTMGMKLLMEYFAVLIRIPSDVSVSNPCIDIIPENITNNNPVKLIVTFLTNLDSLFT